MALIHQLFASYGAPITSGYIGQSVIRYPLGNRDAAIQVDDVLIDLSDQMDSSAALGDGPITSDIRGDAERLTGVMELPAGTDWHDTDIWLIDGDEYTTQRQTAADAVAESAQWFQVLITQVRAKRTQRSTLYNDRSRGPSRSQQSR